MYDLVVRGGTVVSPEGEIGADVAVSGGVVAAVEPEVEGSGRTELDASGLHVFPGLVDAHVHFSEPGRTHWEGFASGTRAFAAGGATTVFDMPLNAYPPTVDGESFDLKREAGERSALVDFALWGAIQPDNLRRMEELAERGVVGFKAFMTPATEDFRNVDDLELYEGMAEAARLGLPVAVHAESPQITGRLTRRALSQLRLSAKDYTESRPAIAELEAISRAVLFAEETGCALHVVHVTIGRGVDLIVEARKRGVDVSCETCAHYLMLTQNDLEELGAIAKCAPPLRSADEREALWERILDGRVPMVTSDHSPCPPDMKAGDDLFRAWGGISGGQSTLNVLLTEGEKRGLGLPVLASISSEAAARRFGLPRKGRVEPGFDADLALADLKASGVLRAEDLFYRHRFSPYVGRELKGRVVHTLVRGEMVFSEGKVVGEPAGRLLRPESAERAPERTKVAGSG